MHDVWREATGTHMVKVEGVQKRIPQLLTKRDSTHIQESRRIREEQNRAYAETLKIDREKVYVLGSEFSEILELQQADC